MNGDATQGWSSNTPKDACGYHQSLCINDLMTLLLKILLSLCVLVFGGASELRAQDDPHQASNAARKIPKKSEVANYAAVEIGHNLSIRPPSNKVMPRMEVVEYKIEENELTPSKKLIEISEYFTAFSNSKITVPSFELKEGMPSYIHFACDSSERWFFASQVYERISLNWLANPVHSHLPPGAHFPLALIEMCYATHLIGRMRDVYPGHDQRHR